MSDTPTSPALLLCLGVGNAAADPPQRDSDGCPAAGTGSCQGAEVRHSA